MTPWVWPTMHLNPPQLDRADHRGVRAGRIVVLHHRHRPRIRQRPVPDDADGRCAARCARCGRSELLDYTNYEGDYEVEMGIGRRARVHARCWSTPSVLIMAWGATVPMIAHAVGIDARRDHHHLGQVGDPDGAHDGEGRHRARACRRGPVHHQRRFTRARSASNSNTSTASGTTPPRTGRRATSDDVYRVDIEGTPTIFQETAFRFTDGSGRDAGHGRVPGHRDAGAQRGARRQRAAARLGHPARPAADRRGRHDSLKPGGIALAVCVIQLMHSVR